MQKVSRKVRNKLRCLWQGHTYYRLIWPGFGRVPYSFYKCQVCGSVSMNG